MKKRERSRRLFKILIFCVVYILLLNIIPSSGSASIENAPREYTKTAKSPDVTNMRIVYDPIYKTADYTCWSPGWGSCWNGTKYNDLNVVKNAGVVRRNTTFNVTGDNVVGTETAVVKGPTDSGYRPTITNWNPTFIGGSKWNLTIPSDAPVGDYQVYLNNSYCTVYVVFDVFETKAFSGMTENQFSSWGYNETTNADEYTPTAYVGGEPTNNVNLAPFGERVTELICSSMGGNVTTPYEACIRVSRVINARMSWQGGSIVDTETMLAANTGLTVSWAKKVALQTGAQLPDDMVYQNNCQNFGAHTTSLTRSMGIPARQFNSGDGESAVDPNMWGWGDFDNTCQAWIEEPDMTMGSYYNNKTKRWLMIYSNDQLEGDGGLGTQNSNGEGAIDTLQDLYFHGRMLDIVPSTKSQETCTWAWNGAGAPSLASSWTVIDLGATGEIPTGLADPGSATHQDLPQIDLTVSTSGYFKGDLGCGDRDFFRVRVTGLSSVDLGFTEGAEYAQIYVNNQTTGTNEPDFAPNGDLKTAYLSTLVWGNDSCTVTIPSGVDYIYLMVDNAKGEKYADDYWQDGAGHALCGKAEVHHYVLAVGKIPPKVTVLSPNGGEALIANGLYSITWNATDLNDAPDRLRANISYSLNSGETYPYYITPAGNISCAVTSYTWNIPDIEVTTCRIKIIVNDTDGNKTFDVSDADFSIKQYNPLNEITNGTGASLGDRFGWNVSGAGDINGDSFNDIIVSAPFAAAGGTERGAVYIFFGYSGINLSNINAANANVTINGATNGGHFGWSVSGVGKVNENTGGYDDIIIGEPDSGSGAAYIFFGRSSWSSSYTTANANVTLTGEGSGDRFGSSVSGAGDVNNDGYGDVLIGAYANSSSKGKAYIFYGASAGPSQTNYTACAANWNITGTTNNFANMQSWTDSEAYATLGEGLGYLQVTFVSAGTGSGVAGNPTPAYPTGLQANDLILLQVTKRDLTGTVTTPTGFTLLYGPDRAGTLVRQWIYYKFAVGTETGTITVTTSTAVCNIARMYAFRNVALTSFTEGAAFTNTTTTSTTILAPTVTTTGPKRLAVAFVLESDDDNAHVAFTGETGGDWTEAVAEFATAAGSDGTVQLQNATMATAGTISGGSFTITADAWCVRAFALIPVSSYMLEIQVNTTSIPAGKSSYALEIYGNRTDENINISVWDGNGWNVRGNISSTTMTLFTYTLLSSEVISDTVKVRFIDQNRTTDTTLSSVYIDYLRVKVVSAGDVTLTGENANDKFGFSVSGAGNVNGDEYDDVIVGAPGTANGNAYVFYGGPGIGAEGYEAGTTNLALTGIASASSINGAGYEANKATDGSLSTTWASANFPTVASPAWLIVNLSSAMNIKRIRLDFSYLADNNDPGDWLTQISTDNISYTTVDTVVNYTGSETYTYNFPTYGTARYVKIYITDTETSISGNAVGITEFEVYEAIYSGTLANITFTGEKLGDKFGYSVSSGDLNNDAAGDLIIGAPGYENSRGRVYIKFADGPKIVNDTQAEFNTGTLTNVYATSDGDVNLTLLSPESVILSQDFTGAFPPTGWSTYKSTANNHWWSSATSNAGGTSPEARFNYTPAETGLFILYSGNVDTTGYTSLKVTFKHMLDWYASPFTIGVKTRHGGGTWNTVWSISPTANVPAETKEVTIANSDVGYSDFQIGWFFDGNTNNIDYWYVDDIVLNKSATYASSGSFTSVNTTSLFNIGVVKAVWDATLNGQHLEFKVSRDGGTTWSFENMVNEETYRFTNGEPAGNTLRFKVLFSAPDTSKTPVLHKITVYYSTGAENISLTGECAGGEFGYSASTAGDMNGDGYEDVIVGAPFNGNNNGSIYVFYGNNIMDRGVDYINYSNSNENLGFSVCSLGDVNNDNYDDVIVGAPIYNGNRGKAYVYSTQGGAAPDTEKPQISGVNDSPDPQEAVGFVNITAVVTDNVGVSNVKVNISGPAGFVPVNVSMAKIPSTNTYYYNVSYSILGTYTYFIWATDASSNKNSSLSYTFTIQDTTKPEITNVQETPDPQEVNGWVNITVTVTDAALDTVKVNISGPVGFTPVNATMTKVSGTDNYYYNTTYSVKGVYSYFIWANDTANNKNSSLSYTFTIQDTTKPEISDLNDNPDPQEVYGYVNITVTVTDNYAVDKVFLNITYPDNSYENISITNNKTGNTYYCNKTYITLGVYSYFIWANDTSNNKNKSGSNPFTVWDTTKPTISSVQASPSSQTPGGYVNISATVTDNYALDTVKVNITYPDSSTENITITQNKTGNTYYCNRSYTATGTYTYFIWANDTSNNKNTSAALGTFTFTITSANQQPNPPTLISPDNNTWTNDSTPLFDWDFSDPDGDASGGFNVTIDDNIDFSSPNYWVNQSTGTNVTQWQFPENTSYTTLLDGTWYWRVKANDTNGAWSNWSEWRIIMIDTSAPTVTAVSPALGATNIAITTTITKTFNESMNQTSVEASFKIYQDGSATNLSGTYSWSGNQCIFTPSSPLSSNTKYWGNVSTGAKDLAGNNLASANNTWFITAAGVSAVVNSPNGFEIWKGNANYWINYTISGGTAPYTVKFYYSTAGTGGPWTFIAYHNQSATGTFNYTWLTPWANSTNCYANVSVNDSTTSGYDLSDSNFTIDSTAPTSSVDIITPYWRTNQLITITVSNAADALSGVKRVNLSYRYSSDNSSWGAWTYYGSSTVSPYTFSFNTASYGGDGFFEFYSRALDNAGNGEGPPSPLVADAIAGVDTTKPTSNVNTISPYLQTTSPLTITATASDDNATGGESGLATVELWVRNSTDNSTWSSWWLFDTDTDPWISVSWDFNFPNGTGYYELYSRARDNATNYEDAPPNNDTLCQYQPGVTPSSSVDAISPYWINSSSTTITATASSSADAVELWVRNSTNNASWSVWWLFNNDTALSWSWDFTFPNGTGYYQFESRAFNNSGGGWEALTGTADAICGYDNAAPTSNAYAISPYVQTSSPITITATASDTGYSGLASAELWHRYSTDNGSWSGWSLFGTDSASPWSWNFNFPNGTGYYEFYTRARDNATNYEAAPGAKDTLCQYAPTAPATSVNIISPYWQQSSPLTVTAAASADANAVELRVRNSTDNSTWSVWWLLGNDTASPWQWSFNFPNGTGYYEFYSRGWNITAGWEAAPGIADAICEYDNATPTSTANGISPYVQTSSPLTVTAIASDTGYSGLASAELWHRYSTDNGSWSGWSLFGTDSASPWSWNFNFPNGTGYYEFYTRARDNATNYEAAPGAKDALCQYAPTAPVTSVNIISPYWQQSSPLTVTATASADANAVELRVRNSTDNSTWGVWWLLGNDTASPWQWSFNFLNGTGYYEFYSRGWNITAGWEAAPGIADAICEYDNATPTSSVNAVPPYWQTASPLTITATASDTGYSGLASVELWVRNSTDNVTFSAWWLFSTDTDPWVSLSWSFTFLNGTGYYEFYSRARDNATNYESTPGSADALCGYDNAAPISSANAISPYVQTTSPITITATASDTGYSGLASVELWYSYSTDNSTGSGWSLFGTDAAPPWSWSFNFPNGTGYYQFYSRARDNATNYEAAPGTNDTLCEYGVSIEEFYITLRYSNGTANFTNTQLVPLYINATNANKIRFRNEGYDWSDWMDYSNKTCQWLLTRGDGWKKVYVQARNTSYYDPDYPEANSTIILDVSAPSISSLTPSQNSLLRNYTVNISAVLTDAGSGSSGINWSTATVIVRIDGTAANRWNVSNKTEVSDGWKIWVNWTFSTDGEIHRVYVEVKDYANNTASVEWQFTVDTTPLAQNAVSFSHYYAKAGQMITIYADIYNNKTIPGTFNVTFYVDYSGWKKINNKSVTIQGGEVVRVDMTYSINGTEGSKTEDLTGREYQSVGFKVVANSTGVEDSQIATFTVVTAQPPPEPATSFEFNLLLTVVVIVVLVLFLKRRKE